MDAEMMAYINSVSDARRQLYAELEKLVLELYPDAELVKSYGIPKYKTGAKTGIWLNYWEKGVSMHGGRTELIDWFRERHPEIKTGKGGVNFKAGDAIPVEDVREYIQRVVEKR